MSFPGNYGLRCTCPEDGKLVLTDFGGSELTSVRVHCGTCPEGSAGRKGKHLGGTTVKPNLNNGEQSSFQAAGINCPGDRPWLGEGAEEDGCREPLVGALINQTNLYFPRTVSALALPNLQTQDKSVQKIRNEIERGVPSLGVLKTLWKTPSGRDFVVLSVKNTLSDFALECTPEQVEEALESLFGKAASVQAGSTEPLSPESRLLRFRRAEFNIIRNPIDEPEGVPDLRVISATIPDELDNWIGKVNLVERLRETRVFLRF